MAKKPIPRRAIWDDYTLMTFGKYKGTKLANVPADYLLYLYSNGTFGPLKDYIEQNLELLKKEAIDATSRLRRS